MTKNEMQALREFRAEIAPPSEETRQRIYAYATGGTPKRRAGFWGHRLLPSASRRLVVALAGAAICVAAAAVVATGTFTGGATHTARPTGSLNGDQAVGGLDVNYVRSGDALSSIAITLYPNVANASVQLQVVHTDATSAGAYAGKAQTQVVFQEDVSTTTPPGASSSDLSTWSGTLSPSQWSGGCQSGLYQIQYLAIPPGRTFANATEQPGSEFGAGEWFSC